MKALILVGKHKNSIAEVIEITPSTTTPIKVLLGGTPLRFHPGELRIMKEED